MFRCANTRVALYLPFPWPRGQSETSVVLAVEPYSRYTSLTFVSVHVPLVRINQYTYTVQGLFATTCAHATGVRRTAESTLVSAVHESKWHRCESARCFVIVSSDSYSLVRAPLRPTLARVYACVYTRYPSCASVRSRIASKGILGVEASTLCPSVGLIRHCVTSVFSYSLVLCLHRAS